MVQMHVPYGDCPEVFKNRHLCISCLEIVKVKRGRG